MGAHTHTHTHTAQPILMAELCIMDLYKGRDSEIQDKSEVCQEVWKQ
jgi:hypothetical protein